AIREPGVGGPAAAWPRPSRCPPVGRDGARCGRTGAPCAVSFHSWSQEVCLTPLSRAARISAHVRAAPDLRPAPYLAASPPTRARLRLLRLRARRFFVAPDP